MESRSKVKSGYRKVKVKRMCSEFTLDVTVACLVGSGRAAVQCR